MCVVVNILRNLKTPGNLLRAKDGEGEHTPVCLLITESVPSGPFASSRVCTAHSAAAVSVQLIVSANCDPPLFTSATGVTKDNHVLIGSETVAVHQ